MKTKNCLCAILAVAGSAFASQTVMATTSVTSLSNVTMQQQVVKGVVTDTIS